VQFALDRRPPLSTDEEQGMEPITVTIEGAKKCLGLGHTKVYELLREGRLRSVKIGRRTLITTESIRELIEKALADPPP
jgi:excisionase family DNA binding protein